MIFGMETKDIKLKITRKQSIKIITQLREANYTIYDDRLTIIPWRRDSLFTRFMKLFI